MSDAERLETLEIKLAHLERGLQELSDVVVRQQRELEHLSLRNRQLLEQLEALRTQAGVQLDPHEPPPHY